MKKILSLLIVLAIYSCKKSTTAEEVLPPSKATQLAPLANATCYTGAVVSDQQSTVTFKWNAAQNTDNYQIDIKNLSSRTLITRATGQTQIDVTLDRGVPYSWSVTSKSSRVAAVAQSDTWKFYNAGLSATSYAPFPAEVVSPLLGQTVTATNGKITLSWTGSDVDGDIASYDIYLGTNDMPALFKQAVVTNNLTGVDVSASATYYWKIITRDKQGNVSDSGVYQFKVN